MDESGNAAVSVDEWAKEAKASSERNRAYFFVYLAALLYVFLIVASTRDVQLLVPTLGVKLPLVDVTLPLVWFYLLSPIAILALHFNFLQNLDSHHHRLVEWSRACGPDGVPRHQIPAFLFDYARLERQGFWPGAIRRINAFLCLDLAPLVLVAMLVGFARYQSAAATAWHLACVALAFAMSLAVRREFQRHEATLTSEPRIWSISLRARWLAGIVGFALIGYVGLAAFVALADGDTFTAWSGGERRLHRALYRADAWPSGVWRLKRAVVSLAPRIEVAPSERLALPSESELKTIAALRGEKEWSVLFAREGFGLDLSGRSLRLASLPGAFLPHVDLRNTSLDGADLRGANLQGAVLDRTSLQDATLSEANLRGASIRRSNLQNVSASFAEMQGVMLERTSLAGGDFHLARLQGAIINGSDLTAVNLAGAYLDGAQFAHSDLMGVDLTAARMHGVVWPGESVVTLAGASDRLTNFLRHTTRRVLIRLDQDRTITPLTYREELEAMGERMPQRGSFIRQIEGSPEGMSADQRDFRAAIAQAFDDQDPRPPKAASDMRIADRIATAVCRPDAGSAGLAALAGLNAAGGTHSALDLSVLPVPRSIDDAIRAHVCSRSECRSFRRLAIAFDRLNCPSTGQPTAGRRAGRPRAVVTGSGHE